MVSYQKILMMDANINPWWKKKEPRDMKYLQDQELVITTETEFLIWNHDVGVDLEIIRIIKLKDWLNSRNFNKEDLSEDTDLLTIAQLETPYIINRCLSGHLDCVMFANEMNRYTELS